MSFLKQLPTILHGLACASAFSFLPAYGWNPVTTFWQFPNHLFLLALEHLLEMPYSIHPKRRDEEITIFFQIHDSLPVWHWCARRAVALIIGPITRLLSMNPSGGDASRFVTIPKKHRIFTRPYR